MSVHRGPLAPLGGRECRRITGRFPKISCRSLAPEKNVRYRSAQTSKGEKPAEPCKSAQGRRTKPRRKRHECIYLVSADFLSQGIFL